MKSTRATNERDEYFQNHEQRVELTRAKQQTKKIIGPFIQQALLWSSSLHPHEIVVVP
jgi:hypothetical protein